VCDIIEENNRQGGGHCRMLIKLIVFTLIAAVVEIAILLTEKHQNSSVKIKEDPMALPWS
jgi:hypothetical protein